jgi:hypothetical protein
VFQEYLAKRKWLQFLSKFIHEVDEHTTWQVVVMFKDGTNVIINEGQKIPLDVSTKLVKNFAGLASVKVSLSYNA